MRHATVCAFTETDVHRLRLLADILWVRGLSPNQIVAKRVQAYSPAAFERPATVELLTRDTADQFRMFDVLEPLLWQPGHLVHQVTLQLPPSTQRFFVEVYHTFDDRVIRELLGRKLSTKARKDLDDVSETTGVPLRSCRRQFDCLKRIFNAMDDRGFQGSIAVQVEAVFCLSPKLSRRYACILFLLFHRFTLQTSRKKTAFLELGDLEYCVGVIISLWVREVGGVGNPAVGKASAGVNFVSGTTAPLVGGSTVVLSNKGRQQPPPTRALSPPQQRSLSTGSFPSTPTVGPASTVKDRVYHGEGSVASRTTSSPDLTQSSASGATAGSVLLRDTDAEDGNQISAWEVEAELAGSSPPLQPGLSGRLHKNVDQSSSSFDIDPLLASRLRDLKTVLLGNRGIFDDYVKGICACLGAHIDVAKLRKFEPRLRGWLKQVLSVGASLGQPKELRDLFEDLVYLTEQIVHLGLGRAEVRWVFEAMTQGISKITAVRRQLLDRDWIQFLEGLRNCILRLHPEKGSSSV